MIENVEQLKNERPDLVESFEKMSKDDLLKQCYLECIDAINMESRVALFMRECTENMSKTNYSLDSLNTLINSKQESDINEALDSLNDNNKHREQLIAYGEWIHELAGCSDTEKATSLADTYLDSIR